MTAEQQAPFGSGFGYRSTAADVLKDIDLSGKNIIVTGGYSGIGIEAVKALVNAGASVTVPARRPDKAREEQIVEDAGVALTRLAAELAEVEALIASAPTREPMLREKAAAADAARAASQQAVEDLAARAAAQEAARDRKSVV